MSSVWLETVGNGAAVVFVLTILALCVWVLRKKGLVNLSSASALMHRQRRLSVVERLPLTPQHSLHLVQMTDQLLLLGSSPGGINLIESTGGTKQSRRLPVAEG